MFAVLFVCSTLLSVFAGSITSASRSPLLSFGDLSEVNLNGALGVVYSIEADALNPGGFIVANKSSVGQIFPNLNSRVLAGRPRENGYRNGNGLQAVFSSVVDIKQVNNGRDIIIADYNNRCLRKLDRETSQVTNFAGSCATWSKMERFYETITASTAVLPKVNSIVHDESRNIFYYLFSYPEYIAEHNPQTDELTMRYKDARYLAKSTTILADSDYKYLYVTHLGGISKISTTTWTRTLVAGEERSRSDSIEHEDGQLLYAKFYGKLNMMVWLVPDQVLVVSEPRSHSLRVVNLVDGVVSTLCKGDPFDPYSPEFVTGDLDTCGFNNPRGMVVVGNDLYVSDETGSDEYQFNKQTGHLLKISYSQPTCTGASTPHGFYEPVQERFTHNQTIRYRCEDGYGISTNYSILTCVRAVHPNGTVYGEWDKSVPTCEVLRANMGSLRARFAGRRFERRGRSRGAQNVRRSN